MGATATTTALDRFIRDARTVFSTHAEEEARWNALRPVLAALLSDPDVVEASHSWPDCRFVNNRIENLLFYEDPDYRFVINALVTSASGLKGATTTLIHDHGPVYTLFGVLDGHQQVQRYERLDDGTRPEHAELRKTFDSMCGPGDIDLVGPHEIHSDDTQGERSVAIIVRSECSENIAAGRYLPEKNTCWQAPGPLQVRRAFY